MEYIIAFWITVAASAAVTPSNSALGTYSRNLLITATQTLNALTGGHPDQSFSGRCGVNRKRHGGIWILFAAVIDKVFWFMREERDHCLNAIEHDRPASANYRHDFTSIVSLATAALSVVVIGNLIGSI